MTNSLTSHQRNVYHQEIAKFDAVASRWWDPEGEFKPLHRINPLRLQYILQRCNGIFARKALDIGCGGGILTESLARQSAQVTGLDMGSEPLQVARLHALESALEITYLQSTAEEHAQNHPEQYDVVTCLEMLEHVPDPASIIAACTRLLKPGGNLFISTLTRTAKSWLLAIAAAEYLLQMVPKGTHDFARFIRPSELLQWTDQHKLICRNISGLNYHPLCDRFTINNRIDANYLVHLQKPLL